jgi:DNA-binding transcriptional LysR family regulator
VLTAAGQQMVAGAERVEREMADLERILVGQDDRLAWTVALTCGDPFVAGMLLAALGDLCAENPEIELNVKVDGRPFDLSRREADVAVRALVLGVDPPEYLPGARVAPVMLAGYVAVAHAAQLDPSQPDTPARWLAFD